MADSLPVSIPSVEEIEAEIMDGDELEGEMTEEEVVL